MFIDISTYIVYVCEKILFSINVDMCYLLFELVWHATAQCYHDRRLLRSDLRVQVLQPSKTLCPCCPATCIERYKTGQSH